MFRVLTRFVRSPAFFRSPSIVSLCRRSMFIQTQTTPNPRSLKFIPGQKVLESGTKEYVNLKAARESPLAQKLFTVEGIKNVLFGADFITISIDEKADWVVIKPNVFAVVMDFFASGQPVIRPEPEKKNGKDEPEDETVAMIKELIETRIRPSVQEDGGDVEFRSFDSKTGIVKVEMRGSCVGCPSSGVTLKNGIENMLMHYVPEVQGVENQAEEESEQAFKSLEKDLEQKKVAEPASASSTTNASSASSTSSSPITNSSSSSTTSSSATSTGTTASS